MATTTYFHKHASRMEAGETVLECDGALSSCSWLRWKVGAELPPFVLTNQAVVPTCGRETWHARPSCAEGKACPLSPASPSSFTPGAHRPPCRPSAPLSRGGAQLVLARPPCGTGTSDKRGKSSEGAGIHPPPARDASPPCLLARGASARPPLPRPLYGSRWLPSDPRSGVLAAHLELRAPAGDSAHLELEPRTLMCGSWAVPDAVAGRFALEARRRCGVARAARARGTGQSVFM